jgi:cobalamin biosynthesis protein CbiG
MVFLFFSNTTPVGRSVKSSCVYDGVRVLKGAPAARSHKSLLEALKRQGIDPAADAKVSDVSDDFNESSPSGRR